MTNILGYLSAVIMGGVLGLTGGGGSILTVPILVYIFKVPPVLATAYSLFIVGMTSVFGIMGYLKSKLVKFRTGIVFAIPAMIGVFSDRKFFLPAIPQELLHLGSFTLTKDMAIMVLFAFMMLAASISMIRRKAPTQEELHKHDQDSALKNTLNIAGKGLLVGLFTGLVGAGGGFLVIPVLVFFAHLEMKEAVATSLLIISINSLFGFLGDVGGKNEIDWMFLIGFSVFTVFGVLGGTWLSKFISSEKLKPAFGWFVLVMGIFILIKTAMQG